MRENRLTNSEWYVLDCLWNRSPMTVMELAAVLRKRVGWAKSTTITNLRRMEGKGLLYCELDGRTRRYFPAVEREPAIRQETHSFLNRVYGGSVRMMMSAMAQEKALSKEEIDALYAILRQAEEDAT